MAYETEQSVSGLLRGALDDVRELFREEVALARVEVRQEMSHALAAATSFGMAAVALWFGALFICAAIALGINQFFGWPGWAGTLIVGAILGCVGLVLLTGASARARKVRAIPRTVETMKENFQ